MGQQRLRNLQKGKTLVKSVQNCYFSLFNMQNTDVPVTARCHRGKYLFAETRSRVLISPAEKCKTLWNIVFYWPGNMTSAMESPCSSMIEIMSSVLRISSSWDREKKRRITVPCRAFTVLWKAHATQMTFSPSLCVASHATNYNKRPLQSVHWVT